MIPVSSHKRGSKKKKVMKKKVLKKKKVKKGGWWDPTDTWGSIQREKLQERRWKKLLNIILPPVARLKQKKK